MALRRNPPARNPREGVVQYIKKERKKERLDYCCNQARRHVVKSGSAEVRVSAEGTSEGECTRGVFPL